MNNGVLKLIVLSILFIVTRISNIFAQHCYIYEDQKWAGNSVTFNINSNLGDAFATQQEYETAITAAAASWNSAGANFEFIYGTDTYDYEKGYEPAGFFQVGKYNEFQGPIGLTQVSLNPDNLNEIVGVNTYFNKNFFFSINPNLTQVDINLSFYMNLVIGLS